MLVSVVSMALLLKDYKDMQYYQEQVLIKIINANKWPQTNRHTRILEHIQNRQTQARTHQSNVEQTNQKQKKKKRKENDNGPKRNNNNKKFVKIMDKLWPQMGRWMVEICMICH